MIGTSSIGEIGAGTAGVLFGLVGSPRWMHCKPKVPA